MKLFDFSIGGVKRTVSTDDAWWGKHWSKVAIAVLVAALILSLFGCSTSHAGASGSPLPGWLETILDFVFWVSGMVSKLLGR